VKKVHALGIFFSYDTDSVVQKNFMDRAKVFKKVLDMWLQRDLSLIGKITILKSLAFSKILYQCGVMNPPQDFIDYIIDLAYNFVWSNKKDKIKRLTLISEYENGGLKMLDISSFLKAQKALWVKRFLSPDKASWKALPSMFLNYLRGKDTFKCNMLCANKPLNFPDFYWEMLKCWFEIRDITQNKPSAIDIRRESLWLNKNITVNEKELRSTLWENNEINIIHDIVNAQGTFLLPAEIEAKYNITCNALKYNTLKDAIPAEWRRILKTMKVPNEAVSSLETLALQVKNKIKNIDSITNKDLYWILVTNKQIKPNITETKWNGLELTGEQWKEIFTVPGLIRNTKIKTFQYKMLYNLLPCNLYLKRISRSITDKCDSCHLLDDTAHYLLECEKVDIFWNSFKQWWQNWTKININLDKQTILVGMLGKTQKHKQINACILLAKWHIYKTKLNQTDVGFYKFLCELKYYLVIEKTIALRNNKLTSYTEIWQELEDHLT
jgi:hypothetical protein